jgi:endonuclease IV
MATLYFDLFDGEVISRDDDGTHFEDIEAAKQSAVQSLLELKRSQPATNDAAELMYVVRDGSDQTAFTARLLLLVT